MLRFSPVLAVLLALIWAVNFLLAAPVLLSREEIAQLDAFMPRKLVALGNLQGGLQMTLEVDEESLRRDLVSEIQVNARRFLRDARIPFSGVSPFGDGAQVRLVSAVDLEKALRELNRLNWMIEGPFGARKGALRIEGEGETIRIAFESAAFDSRLEQARQTAEIHLRRHFDAFGYAAARVFSLGRKRIVLQVNQPGAAESLRWHSPVVRVRFHRLHESIAPAELREGRRVAGYRVYVGSPSSSPADGATPTQYLLQEVPLLLGERFSDIRTGFDENIREHVVRARSGMYRVGTFPGLLPNFRTLALAVDDRVAVAPIAVAVQSEGWLRISGGFNASQAEDVAIMLRAGGLPARLNLLEERTIYSITGAENAVVGRQAIALGAVAVLLLSALSGGATVVLAIAAMTGFGVLASALLVTTGTTLSLAGMAGFGLALVLAIDSHAQISRRIRDETASGTPIPAAIEVGFNKSLLAIADGHFAVAAGAIALYCVGLPPFQEFAAALSLGLLASLLVTTTIVRQLLAWWQLSVQTKTCKCDDAV
jgi:protein-export membrane protein SecD